MKPLLLFFAISISSVTGSICNGQLKSETQFGLSRILSIGGVEIELELTLEQSERLNGLWMEVQLGLEQAFQNHKLNFSPKLSSERKEELQRKLNDGIKAVREKETRQLEEVLLDSQLKRLKQIRFQFMKRNSEGLSAIRDDLNLTEGQLSEIEDLTKSLKDAVRRMRMELSRNDMTRAEFEKELVKLQSDVRRDLAGVLTSKQAAKLRELEGKTFEFDAKKRSQAKRDGQ